MVRKPYPMTRIGETMKQLEGLQYEIELYINMGYYTIMILSACKDMETIVNQFEKLVCNRLPKGMCDFGDIYQTKVD